MPWPGSFTPQERYPVPFVQEAEWAPGPVRTVVENLAASGIQPPDRPAHGELLYWLQYPPPQFYVIYKTLSKDGIPKLKIQLH